MFDTKIAIILQDSLEVWQKLNITSFLTSGIIGQNADLIGENYKDRSNYQYLPLNRQPVIILSGDNSTLKKIHERICNRSLPCSIYISDMFTSGHDEANRETVSRYYRENLPIVGLAIREEKKIVDKITKGAKLHF